ncbi:hypothetical protein M8C21_006423 [Ambrosia artemisiifolia]|uniref:Knottins-like domain-containing protein n=1 Tax=Ambrosia artemisiifolia TaxID=4212 RepID=A0AAD5CNN6_AMBAR|nr:hypothetical protein M8C21_006423 [Ambrosia artemisiifolia]
MANNSVSYIVFLLFVFILAILEIAIVNGKLCQEPSKTWSGTCKDKHMGKCDRRCMKREGAKHGACRQHESTYMCFCYFDCDPKNQGPPPGASRTPVPRPPVGGGGGGQPPAA